MEHDERLKGAEIVQVIKTTLSKGRGVEGDPLRTVIRYYGLDGEFIGETLCTQARGTLSASSTVR